MSECLNFPLLDVVRASEEWSVAKTQSLSKITQSMLTVDFDTANFYHVGQRATLTNLERLRTAVVTIAQEHGFPQHSRGRRDSGTAFDRAVARTLHEMLPIAPSEAAKGDVWNFINVRVLLDVLVWRWGAWEAEAGAWSVSQDRLFQPARTAFGRLWWRVELMGAEAASTLSEDQCVQLMERPRIAGYRPLANAITRRLRDDETRLNKDELLRVALKRLGRRMAVFSVFLMGQRELDSLIDGVFLHSAIALGTDPAVLGPAAERPPSAMTRPPQVQSMSDFVWPH